MSEKTSSWTSEQIAEVARTLESQNAEAVLRWAADTFSEKIGLASSFGAEDVVLIDLIARLKLPIQIFTLDTGRLPEQTYEVMEAIRKQLRVTVTVYFPDKAGVEQLEREKGLFSFRESIENRKECCGIRKVEPLNRALSDLDAWMTGLRRAQAVTRGQLHKVELDRGHNNIVKLNPLADWTEKQVWEYIKEHKVPYNKLHDLNYPSIGCSPCTRAVGPGEDIRAGRWWWEQPEHKECGIHPPSEKTAP